MLFSILSSIYCKENPEHFDECMNSIWEKQTLRAAEMVLVEDGKLPPELGEKILYWQNRLGKILKVIKLPENVGAGRAKNIGLKYCSHDIICIVDTDDICVPNRFEKQIAFFESHPNIDVLGGQIIEFVNNKNITLGSRKVPQKYNDLINFAKIRSPVNHMTVAYKKHAILDIGGYQHHLWMEDYNLFLRLIAKGYIIYNLPIVLVYARVDNGMYSRRCGWQYVKSEWKLFQLKRILNFQNILVAWAIFCLRSFPRILPVGLLKYVYQFVRINPRKVSDNVDSF